MRSKTVVRSSAPPSGHNPTTQTFITKQLFGTIELEWQVQATTG